MHFHCRKLPGRDRHRRGDKIMRAETSAQQGRFRTVYASSGEGGLPGKASPPGGITPVQYLRGRTWGGAVLQRNTGSLEGIDRLYYANAYPVRAIVYGLYPMREPDEKNLDPMRDAENLAENGDLNCVAQSVIEHFQGAQRGQGLTPARRQKLVKLEATVHEFGATFQDVADLERILKRAIIVRDITGADLYNSGKCQQGRYRKIELILHSGDAWGRSPFPQAREVHIHRGDV